MRLECLSGKFGTVSLCSIGISCITSVLSLTGDIGLSMLIVGAASISILTGAVAS